MLKILKNKFCFTNTVEINEFIYTILTIGENYLKLLVSKNKIYLPDFHSEKDVAVDLLAEILIIKDKALFKFNEFFDKNFSDKNIRTDEEAENFIRAFVYSVIQNNLIYLYRDHDPLTYNILRNLKSAVKELKLFTSQHITDKYIHFNETADFNSKYPEKDDLLKIIYYGKIFKNVYNLKIFLKLLFEKIIEVYGENSFILMNDLASVIKSILASEFMSRDGHSSESEHLSEKVNIKFVLDDVKLFYSEKLEKYIYKNNLSQNFGECMYKLIDEVVLDLNEGNVRRSVLELMKQHFNSEDRILFYKVQYCLEIFEKEVIKRMKSEYNISDTVLISKKNTL